MPLILNGDTGISGVDGSAGTPSYQGNDTNTGIFYPAADTIAFAEGGAEIARFDSSGRFGIGTDSPAYQLQVRRAGGAGSLGISIDGIGTAQRATQYFAVGDSTSNTTGHGFYTRDGTATDNLRMFIDNLGNVGIGTASPSRKLDIVSTASTTPRITGSSNEGGYLDLHNNAQTTGRFRVGQGYGTGSDNIAFLNNESNAALVFGTNNTERMRITSGGDVGIGTSSPSNQLHVFGSNAQLKVQQNASTNSNQLILQNTTSNLYFALDSSSGGSFGIANAGIIWLDSNNPLIFATNNSQRMRITNQGALLVGTSTTLSSTDAVHKIGDTGGSTAYARLMMQERSGNWISFNDGAGSHFGTISRSGGGVSYGSNSDYRLKENIEPMTGALAKVQQLKPCTYTWKETGKQGDGFIAHELQEVCPDAVVGEKDAINPESDTPMYQQVDTSYLVATLTAAIQEQQAMIEELKQEVAALKGV